MIPLTLRIRDGSSFADFRIDADPRRTVLDMLEGLRAGGGTVPAYRHSCHHGSCGTCGATIDGMPALMCLTTAAALASPRPRVPGGPAVEPERDDRGAVLVAIEPLAKMSVVAGIAVVPGTVFEGIPRDAAYLVQSEDRDKAPLPSDPTTAVGGPGDIGTDASWRPTGRVRFEACIECGLCVAACPVVAPFIGPAALAAVDGEANKRPDRRDSMLAVAGRPDGVASCGKFFLCSRVCPQAVAPGRRIQHLRNALVARD